MKALTPPERLIVAADFEPPKEPTSDCESSQMWVYQKLQNLGNSLRDTKVIIKMNSALRAYGYSLIKLFRAYGLRVFADLKLFDIGQTLKIDGRLLNEVRPEILTVSCLTGAASMKALKAELPDTEVLGVTILTTFEKELCAHLFKRPEILDNVVELARLASESGMDGIICAPTEAVAVRKVIRPEMTVNTPNIRPKWIVVKGDDQNAARQMTPIEAIDVGIDRIVMGRPIIQSENPYEAVIRTIEEIAAAIAATA